MSKLIFDFQIIRKRFRLRKKINFPKLFKFLLQIIFLPFVLPIKVLRTKRNIFLKIITILLSLFVLLPIWGIGAIVLAFVIYVTGIFPVSTPVTGSSMLPTITDGSSVPLRPYSKYSILNRNIERGDIVTFSNAQTKEVDLKASRQDGPFIKRVIGIQGDKILIKDGFVYLNGQLIQEPYTLSPRSTFGGTKIRDCEEVVVEPSHVFVLGDNRKRTVDSRTLGVIAFDDIEARLGFKEQKQFQSKWRNTDHDNEFKNKSEMNIDRYLELLNKKREENKLKPLKYIEKLSKSAEKRAKVMLQYDDLSHEATKSGYTMQKAISEAGYYNIVTGEFPVLGYYNEEEFIDFQFEYPDIKEFLLNKDYQEIGISSYIGKLNNCPVQITVQHLAGYVPPNYNKEDVEGWKKILSDLKGVQPGWQDLKNRKAFYENNKNDVNRINEIISIRIVNINAILAKMEVNQWLNQAEQRYVNEDTNLYNEMDALANRLNSKTRN